MRKRSNYSTTIWDQKKLTCSFDDVMTGSLPAWRAGGEEGIETPVSTSPFGSVLVPFWCEWASASFSVESATSSLGVGGLTGEVPFSSLLSKLERVRELRKGKLNKFGERDLPVGVDIQ
jgi:hypothetical protein